MYFREWMQEATKEQRKEMSRLTGLKVSTLVSLAVADRGITGKHDDILSRAAEQITGHSLIFGNASNLEKSFLYRRVNNG